MVKLVAVTPSASVHEIVREVVDVALSDTARGPVEVSQIILSLH